MKIWQILACATTAGLTLPAMAQLSTSPSERTELRSDVERRVREALGRFDANKDGIVTNDEMRSFAEAKMKVRTDAAFAAMDIDKSGSISRAEFDAASDKFPVMRFVRVMHGPDMPPPPGAAPDGPALSAPPAPREFGKPGAHTRMMFQNRAGGHGFMAMGDGGQIIIDEAVKKALSRFDAADTNKDGKVSPDERGAARGKWRDGRGTVKL